MGWEQSGGGLALNFDWVGDDKFYTGFREIFPKFLASKLMHHPISLSEHKYILKREEHIVLYPIQVSSHEKGTSSTVHT